MKTNKIICTIIVLFLLFNSCTKDDDRGFPSVTTLSNAEVFNDGTIIHGEISQDNVFEIIDHGVVYCIEKNSSGEENYEKISLGTLTTGNTFSVLIERNLAKNVMYVAKVFVTTKEKTVYGNEITFLSKGGKPPVINSYWPEKGFAGDTLFIRGQYFSRKSDDNKVKFANLNAQVVYSSDSILKVIIPALHESYKAILKVEVGDYTVQADKTFELSEPAIYSFYPEKIMPGEVFYIKGKGLSTVNSVFKFNNYPSDYYYFSLKSSSDTLLEVLTDTNVPTGTFEIYLKQLDKEINSGKKITMYLPQFTSISPTTVWIGSIIEIKGTDLQKIYTVLIGNDEMEIISVGDNLIKAKVLQPFVSSNVSGKVLFTRDIYYDGNLNFKPPVISSVTPSIVTYGETLNITGDYFIPGLSTNINGENTELTIVNRNKANYYVSYLLPRGSNSLNLFYLGNTFGQATLNFTIPEIKIASITPTEIKNGTEIFIKFENLPPSITKDKVTRCWLERNPMIISDVSQEGIKVIVDETFNCSEYPTITFDIGQQTITGERLLHLNQPWKQFTFPEIPSYQSYMLCSTYDQSDNSLYAIAHPEFYNNKLTGILYKYSPEINKWDKISYMTYFDFEAPSKMFSTGNDIYVVGYSYSEQSWNTSKYSKSAKKWTRIKGIPDYTANIEFGGNLFTMVVNDRIFIGKRDWLYEYDAANNKWMERTKIPTERELLSPATFTYNSKSLLGFPAYSTSSTEVSLLFEYDPLLNQWKNLGEFETAFFYNTEGGSYSTSNNNRFYFTGRSQIDGVTKLVEFNPATLNFREMTVPTDRPNGAFLLFFFNNQLYLGTHKDFFYKIPVSGFSEIYR